MFNNKYLFLTENYLLLHSVEVRYCSSIFSIFNLCCLKDGVDMSFNKRLQISVLVDNNLKKVKNQWKSYTKNGTEVTSL